MVSGRETLASIERAINDIQRDEKRLQKDLEDANKKRMDLVQQRTKSVRELAELHIEYALEDGIIDDADRLTHQVEALLKAREKTILSLQKRLETLESERQVNLQDCDQISTKIAELETKLDTLAEQAEKALMTTPDYKKLHKRHLELESIYEKAAEKTDQAEENRDLKSRAYKADPLFMYLWQRKYGSAIYQSNSIIRWLDEKIAKLVDYNKARANYAMLQEIPERLQTHLSQIARERDQLEADLETMQADKIKELADQDLYQNLAKARQTEQNYHKERDQLGAELSETTSQLNLYAEGRDHAYKKAVENTADFIERDSVDDLMEMARDTDTPQDDRIAKLLSSIDKDIVDLADKTSDNREKLTKLFKRKQELIELAAEFRRSHYDDPGSVFDQNTNLNMLLEELLKGVITGAEYWRRAKRGHRWRSRPADSYRYSSPLPPFGGSFGGKSKRRRKSRRKSRRRSKGPDFRTGGGF